MTNTNTTIEQSEALFLFLTQSQKMSKDESSSTQSVKNINTTSYAQVIDVLSKAEVSVGSGAPLPPSNKGEGAATLSTPTPMTDSQLMDLSAPETTNMMALIGYAMALCAQADSLSYSIFYQISNENKEYAAEMAPVDGKLVEAAANAGAAATLTEAAQARTEAITNIVGGVTMLATGGITGLSELNKAAEAKDATGLVNGTEGALKSSSALSEDASSQATKEAVDGTVKEGAAKQTGIKGLYNNLKNTMSKTGKLGTTAQLLKSTFESSVGIQIGMAIPNNLSKSKNSSEQARQQEIQGVNQANEKIVEQGDIAYSNTTTQQYQSNYGAMDKNVDSSTQNWESAIQAITQGLSKLWQA